MCAYVGTPVHMHACTYAYPRIAVSTWHACINGLGRGKNIVCTTKNAACGHTCTCGLQITHVRMICMRAPEPHADMDTHIRMP